MEDGARHRAIIEAAEDATAQAARERVCATVGAAFCDIGLKTWLGGFVVGSDRAEGTSPFGFGDDATVGLNVILQIAGDLTLGAAMLLRRNNV